MTVALRRSWPLLAALLALGLQALPGVAATLVPLGDPFPLDTPRQIPGFPPQVVSSPDGKTMVLWATDLYPGGTVLARFYDLAQPGQLGKLVDLGAPIPGNYSWVAGAYLPSGRFVVIWTNHFLPVGWLQSFLPDGTPAGDRVAFNLPDVQQVVPLPSGNLLILYRTLPDQLHLRLVSPLGTPQPLDLFSTVASVRVGGADVSVAPDGSFLLVYTAESPHLFVASRVTGIRFDASGVPAAAHLDLTDHSRVANIEVRAAYGPNGRWLVGWSAHPPSPTDPTDIGGPGRCFVRSVDAAGNLGAPVEAAEVAADRDQYFWDLKVDPAGDAVVAWTETRYLGPPRLPGPDVFLRALDLEGRPRSPITRATLHPGYFLVFAYLGIGANGRLLAAWDDADSDLDARLSAPRARAFELQDCDDPEHHVCLADGRFEVGIEWTDPSSHATQRATAHPLTGDTGLFWFFGPDNFEAIVKVLDGGPVNGRFWVFGSLLTSLECRITVTDSKTGASKVYGKPAGPLQSFADTSAFASATTASSPAASPIAAAGRDGTIADPAPAPAGTCGPGTAESLCLTGGRFAIEVELVDPRDGSHGKGKAVPLAGDTGGFWFFDAGNVEMLIKVLDGRAVNGQFWVFYGLLSSVETTIRVTDTATGAVRTYTNPAGPLATRADTAAFHD